MSGETPKITSFFKPKQERQGQGMGQGETRGGKREEEEEGGADTNDDDDDDDDDDTRARMHGDVVREGDDDGREAGVGVLRVRSEDGAAEATLTYARVDGLIHVVEVTGPGGDLERKLRESLRFIASDKCVVDGPPSSPSSSAAAAAPRREPPAVRWLHKQKRFVCLGGDGLEASLRYDVQPASGGGKDVLRVCDLHVPAAMRGRGVSDALVMAAFDLATDRAMALDAGRVQYVASRFLRNHPELRGVVAGASAAAAAASVPARLDVRMARTESVVNESRDEEDDGARGGDADGDPPDVVRLPHAFARTWARVRRALTEERVDSAAGLGRLMAGMMRSGKERELTRGLRNLLAEELSAAEAARFFAETLPFVRRWAVRVESEFAGAAVGRLRAGHDAVVELNRAQVLSLMACSFFSLHASGGGGCPNPNFERLFTRVGERPSQAQKVRCVLRYFDAMRERLRAGGDGAEDALRREAVCFARRSLAPSDREWLDGLAAAAGGGAAADRTLVPLQVLRDGTIEDDEGALQMDFANRRIGGGVLGLGCVQEEIRFVINPECLVSLLLCPTMRDDEAVYIVGAERFSDYEGYARSFRCGASHRDTTALDAGGRRATAILAADALFLARSGERRQYMERDMRRELAKAYCAFSAQDGRQPAVLKGHPYTAVATGNWGCGAFGGHVVLKAMLQWVAATACCPASHGLPVRYYTFAADEAEPLFEVARELQASSRTAGWLWQALLEFSGRARDDPDSLGSDELAAFLCERARGGEVTAAAFAAPAAAAAPAPTALDFGDVEEGAEEEEDDVEMTPPPE